MSMSAVTLGGSDLATVGEEVSGEEEREASSPSCSSLSMFSSPLLLVWAVVKEIEDGRALCGADIYSILGNGSENGSEILRLEPSPLPGL